MKGLGSAEEVIRGTKENQTSPTHKGVGGIKPKPTAKRKKNNK